MKRISRHDFEKHPIHEARVAFKSDEPTVIGEEGDQTLILGVDHSIEMPHVGEEEREELPNEQELKASNEEAREWLK